MTDEELAAEVEAAEAEAAAAPAPKPVDPRRLAREQLATRREQLPQLRAMADKAEDKGRVDRLKPSGGSQKVRALLNGFTSGLAPRMVSALDSALPGGRSYEDELSDNRALYNDAAEKHPWLNLTGGVAQPSFAGKGKALESVLSAAGRYAVRGGVQSSIQGAASSRGDLISLDAAQRAQDEGLKGAVIGGIAGPAFKIGGDKLAEKLRKEATEQALNTIVKPGIADPLAKMGIKTEAARQELGDFLRKGRDSQGERLLPAFANAETVVPRVQDAMERRVGPLIDDAVKTADEAALRTGQHFNSGEAADLMQQRLMNKRTGVLSNVEKGATGQADDLIGKVRSQELFTKPLPTGVAGPAAPMGNSFAVANEAKKAAQGAANFSDSAPAAPAMFRKATSGLKDSIVDQVGRVAGPDVADQLSSGNKQWQYLQRLLDLATDKASRDAQKSSVGGLTSAAAANVGASLAGGPGAAVAGMVAPPLMTAIRQRGNSTAANVLGGASTALRGGAADIASMGAVRSSNVRDLLKLMSPEEAEQHPSDYFEAN